MNLKSRIPRYFYKLFGSKYVDYYMAFLVAIYQESRQSYSTFGLTEDECEAIINEMLPYYKVDWREENEDSALLLEQGNAAAVCMTRFSDWGWLKEEFDETLNCNVVFFPEYSQLFVELFEKLLSEDDKKERESILAIYSYLFTYISDQEKNNEILKSALTTTRRLVQLLANMREGMREYFDELSGQRGFRGIQEVLIKEINNSDSRRYAILTTTDSFYRYKEAVKELIEQGLSENEMRKQQLVTEHLNMEENSRSYIRTGRVIDTCDEAMELISQIEREFDIIEKRYNMLIEQKTIFASRAVARMRYILQEGLEDEERTVTLVNLLGKSEKREQILADFTACLHITAPYRVMKEQSFYSKRERERPVFDPEPVVLKEETESGDIDDFVLKPLYTRRQLRQFIDRNSEYGRFKTTEETVQSVEDLEKLLFVWQEVTEKNEAGQKVILDGELTTEEGLRFSGLIIEEE